MLSKFFTESSIHGLKYVIEGKNGFFKLIWSVIVLASITIAIVIIYFNVKNWEESPAVVTSVEPILVKDNVPMPEVLFCPYSPDINLMIGSLFTRYPDLMSNEALKDFQDFIIQIGLESAFDRCSESVSNSYSELKLFKDCESGKDDEERCQFVYLLNAISRGLDTFGYKVKSIMAFIKNAIQTKTIMTVHSLQSYVENATKTSLEPFKRFPKTVATREFLYTVQTYCHFFPVWDDQRTEMRFHTLEEFDLELFRVEDPTHFGPILGLLLQNQQLSDTRTQGPRVFKVVKHILEGIRIFLNVDSIPAMVKLLDFYAYDPYSYPMFSWLNMAQKIQPECQGSDQFPCAKKPSAECRDYCSMVAGKPDLVGKIQELFDMSVPKAGNQGHQRTILPLCQYSGHNITWGCFEEIVSSSGICYYLKHGKPEMIKGIGEANSLLVMLQSTGSVDFHGSIANKSIRRIEGDLIILPPNHLTLGEVSEEEFQVWKYSDRNGAYFNSDVKLGVDQILETSSGFREMTVSKRQCLYPDERTLKFFPIYSMPNCQLECTWHFAAQSCGCVPWFLRRYFPVFPLCEVFGNLCFKRIVDLRHNQRIPECYTTCLPDCDLMTFRMEVKDSKRLSVGTKSCLDFPKDPRDVLTCLYVEHRDRDLAPVVGQIFKRASPARFEEMVGRIRIYAERKTTLKITKTATVTIIDMISNIGGTLGLFCGFSILSGVELFYWMFLAFSRFWTSSMRVKPQMSLRKSP